MIVALTRLGAEALNPSKYDSMKRITFLALLLTGLLCSTAQADFFIDNFSILDDVGGGATSIGSSGITVEVTNSVGVGSSTVADDANSQYVFTASSIGDSFIVSYDWGGGAFSDLSSVSVSGLQLTQSPLNFFGDWTLTIDTGVSISAPLDPTISTISPIDLDDATELTYTFTYNGGGLALPPSGDVIGLGTFGGTSNSLFATPEPTAFMMLGTAGLIVLSRRRRKS